MGLRMQWDGMRLYNYIIISEIKKKTIKKLGIVLHTCNPLMGR